MDAGLLGQLQFLQALLPVQGSNQGGQAGRSLAKPVIELDPNPSDAPCLHPSSTHDLAALTEGNLSPQGLRRLARHLVKCRTCQLVLISMIDDGQRVRATGSWRSPFQERPRSNRESAADVFRDMVEQGAGAEVGDLDA